MESYVCIDIETTGLNPKTDKIIEIGAVRVIHGKIENEISVFVNPGRVLSDKIKELTHICDEDLHEAPFIQEVIGEIIEFIGELPLLGHNILFDYSFLKRAAVNQGIPFEKEGIDTLRIARTMHPEFSSRRLHSLCELYQIDHIAHRALGDAEATVSIYHKFKEELENQFMEDKKEQMNFLFQPQKLNYQVKKEGPASKKQKQRLYDLIQRHKVIVEYDIDNLTKNEASRYTDIILSTYGR